MSRKYVSMATATAAVIFCCVQGWSQTTKGAIPSNAISNAIHYSDSGLGPATGRAGNATVDARALLAKDGSTLIEVTTGTLDDSTLAPGNLDKLQYKPIDANGNFFFAKNWNGLTGGYYSFTETELARHQQLQIQTNISGIDKRTDVVTLVETVKYRPDLSVQSISNPSSAVVNQPVNISAVISELNTDTGANANCVLSVDGTAVDQAHGIWVDAGGTVSCAFSYTFPTTGSHSLKVTAANVIPADWDLSNNSATGTINIVNPDTQLHYYSQFYDYLNGNQTVGYGQSQYYNGALVYSYQFTGNFSGSYQYGFAYFYGQSTPFQFPISNAIWTESMDGVVKFQQSTSILPNGWSVAGTYGDGTTYTYNVAYGYFDNGVVFQAYSYAHKNAAGQILDHYDEGYGQRYGGDVTYQSTQVVCGTWLGTSSNCPTGSFYTSNSSHSVYGSTRIVPGSQWSAKLSITDASVERSVNPSIALTSTGLVNYGSTTPYTYNYNLGNGYTGTDSFTSYGNYNITDGYVNQ